MIKRECIGKGCEGEKSKSKEKTITNHISYIWVNIRIANALKFKPNVVLRIFFLISSGQTTNNINQNLNLGLWNSYLFNLNYVMINSLYALSYFSFKIILSICCYSFSLILFLSISMHWNHLFTRFVLLYYIEHVFSFIFIIYSRIELNLCGTIAWTKLNYRFGRHSVFNRLY